jgi:DNA-binding transcriptional LysR family regulator
VPAPSAVSYTYHLRNSLVALGRYLTVVPGSMLYFNVAKLPIKPLPIPMPIRPRPVAIVKLKHRTLSPVAKLFIEATREIAEPLAKKK